MYVWYVGMYIYIYMYVCLYVCMLCYVMLCYVMLCYVISCYVSMYVCMYVCTYVCMYVCIYIYIHIYVYQAVMPTCTQTVVCLGTFYRIAELECGSRYQLRHVLRVLASCGHLQVVQITGIT